MALQVLPSQFPLPSHLTTKYHSLVNKWTLQLFPYFKNVQIKQLVSERNYTSKYDNILWTHIYWSIGQLDTLFSIIYSCYYITYVYIHM